MSKTDTKTQTTALAPVGAGMSAEAEAALTKRDTPCQFLSLMQGKSGPVEDNEPKGIRAGDYLLGGRTRIPAYKEGGGCKALIGISRPSAVYFKNNEKEFDTHDEKSPEWAKIAAAKAANDKGAKIGIEVLVWLPDHDTHAVLAFMNNAREEAGPAFQCRAAKVPAIIDSKMVGKKNGFFVPKIGPAPAGEAIKLPSEEQTRKALAFFESYKTEKPAPEPAANARPR